MNFRVILILVVVAAPFVSRAQDKIFKRDGSVTEVKIKSVGTQSVTYVRFDNQSGPEYVVSKSDVEKITYQNGTTDVFEETSGRPHFPPPHHRRNVAAASAGQPTDKINYGPNVLSLAPVQFSENGLGAGLSYERLLDKSGIIAFYCPVIVTVHHDTYYDNSLGTNVNGQNDAMFYAMPGIKIYPTGSYGVVKYAIGPSLVIATGQKSNQYYDPYYSAYYQTMTHTMLGVVVNNSLNINPTRHVYLGVEFGFGFTYLNSLNGVSQGATGLVQGGFKIGYRF